MSTLLLFAFLVGLDNLLFGVALGSVLPSSTTRNRLAISFTLCEALMPIVGVLLAGTMISGYGAYAEAIAMVSGLLIAVALLLIAPYIRHIKFDHRYLWLLPLLLSLDNLTAGLSLVLSGYSLSQIILVIALISGTLSLLGLELGHRLSRQASQATVRLSASVLLSLSAYHFVTTS